MCDELGIMTKYQSQPILRYLKIFPQKNGNMPWKRLSHNMISEPNIKHGTWYKAEAMTTHL
jgi:hypothetical protein